MKQIYSAYTPRNVKISKDEYLMIYPNCCVTRRLNLLFTRHGGTLLLDDPIADFLVGKYSDINYFIKDAQIIVPDTNSEPTTDTTQDMSEPRTTGEETPPSLEPIDPKPVEDIDNYIPKAEKAKNDKGRNTNRAVKAPR